MPKVFIANKGVHDYEDAARYGEIFYVTKGTISKFAVGIMARKWADALADSKPDDFLVISSLTTICSIGAALFAMKHGHLNLLIFRNGRYIARKMMLTDLDSIEKEEINNGS